MYNKLRINKNKDFLVAQMVKNLAVLQEARVRSLGWEVPLEKGIGTQYNLYFLVRHDWSDLAAAAAAVKYEPMQYHIH